LAGRFYLAHLSDLHVTIRADEDNRLFSSLAASQPLAEALESLRIELNDKPQRKIIFSLPIRPVSITNAAHSLGVVLSNLKLLRISSTGDQSILDLQGFVQRIRCPSLTTIDVSQFRCESSRDVDTGQGEGHATTSPPLQAETIFPALRVLKTSLGFSLSGIGPLEFFGASHRTVDSLEICQILPFPLGAKDAVKGRLQATLAQFRLRALSITFPVEIDSEWEILIMLLKSVGTGSLEKLSVILKVETARPITRMGYWCTGPKQEMFVVPALHELTLKDIDLTDFVCIMRAMVMKSLKSVSLTKTNWRIDQALVDSIATPDYLSN